MKPSQISYSSGTVQKSQKTATELATRNSWQGVYSNLGTGSGEGGGGGGGEENTFHITQNNNRELRGIISIHFQSVSARPSHLFYAV